MITIFLLMFIFCLISNLIRSGDAYIYFSRFITAVNSIRDKSPRFADDYDRHIEVEYKYGRTRYAIIVLKRDPLPWVKAGALKGDQWIDRTAKILFYAGPFRNFHGLGITPRQISPKYQKLAFAFQDGAVVHVNPDDAIVPTIKSFYQKLKIQ